MTMLTPERKTEIREATALGAGISTPAAYDLLDEIDRLRAERDEAIAHDRQPYPTAWAYEQAIAGELAEALGKAADTFADLVIGLRLLRHETAASACQIAEDASRAALARYEGS